MDEMLRQAAGHGQSRTLLAALAVAAALLTGCGSGGDDTSSISEADLK
jgi:hypothetical protein